MCRWPFSRFHLAHQHYSNDDLTAGPDGAVWFTNPGNNTIGRITTAGIVKDYQGDGIANPWAITTGPDGAVWFTNWDTNTIGRLTTAGKVTIFRGPISAPASIAAVRYGALWYTNWSGYPPRCAWSIGRVTTKGSVTCYKNPKIEYPQHIVFGSDSSLWFTNGGGYAIGRITTRGVLTMYPLKHWPGWIAAGPDGALWFTYTNNNAIGRITTKSVLSSYTAKTISRPEAIAAGPDSALWFLNAGNNTIGRISAKGQVTSYGRHLGFSLGGANIAAGPDGAMWFTSPATNTIGRISTIVTPWIFGKTPASGAPGTQVTITGRNLAHATQVAFNGAQATIVSDTATYVVAIVPPGATTGPIAVTTPAGTATRNGWFTVITPHGRIN